MSILELAIVGLAGGLAVLILGPRRPRTAGWLAVATAALSVALAGAISPDDVIALGGVTVAGSDLVRLFALAWAFGILGASLLSLSADVSHATVAAALVGLGISTLALAVHDPASSFPALGAVGVVAVVATHELAQPAGGERRLGRRAASLSIVGACLVGAALVAWGSSPAGPLAGADLGNPSGRAALGLALLGIGGAVIIRAGLVPAHLWQARFVETSAPLAVPAALPWGVAAFILVALEWSQAAFGPSLAEPGLEHAVIVGFAAVSIVAGGFAAVARDDLGHVLGYAGVQSGGIALLAFASLRPEAVSAAGDWLLGSAAVATAFAAWITAARQMFGTTAIPELGGWARRAPILGLAFALILVAAVGLPGMALFDARTGLLFRALPGLPGTLILLIALAPIAYLGRIGLGGLGAIGPAVASGAAGMPKWHLGRPAGWSGRDLLATARSIPAAVRLNEAPLAGLVILALGVVSLWVAIAGVGGDP